VSYGEFATIFADKATLIGDVNGDGYEDIAISSSYHAFPNVFRILLGIAPPAAHISEDTDALITLLAPIFPQPASDIIMLQSRIEQSGLYTINLEPLAGGAAYRVYQSALDKGQTQLHIDCSTIPSGVYIITINAPTERLSTHLKVSIQH
jgi:hypothetical protein